MDIIKYVTKLISADVQKATEDELTLQYYEMWITEGIRSAIHGDFYKITEIYIPELKLTINQAIPPINLFICDYDRYTSKSEPISGKRPKLVKTIIISKNSEAGKTLLWLSEVYTNKKEKEASLCKLFEDDK